MFGREILPSCELCGQKNVNGAASSFRALLRPSSWQILCGRGGESDGWSCRTTLRKELWTSLEQGSETGLLIRGGAPGLRRRHSLLLPECTGRRSSCHRVEAGLRL